MGYHANYSATQKRTKIKRKPLATLADLVKISTLSRRTIASRFAKTGGDVTASDFTSKQHKFYIASELLAWAKAEGILGGSNV